LGLGNSKPILALAWHVIIRKYIERDLEVLGFVDLCSLRRAVSAKMVGAISGSDEANQRGDDSRKTGAC
jgi:hypothetical protein